MLKLKKINIRYISILIILSLVFPTLFLTAYAGVEGRYIGSAIYMLVGILSLYEIIRSFKFNKYVSLITASTIILFFLISFDKYKLVTNPVWIESKKIKWLLKDAFNWKPYLMLLLTSFIPIALQPNVAKEKLGFFKTQIFITIIMMILFTFFKGAWIMNVFNIRWMIFFVSIAIIADSFGYFGGLFFGKKLFKGAKLAPKISPNKTWAGAFIGFIFSFSFILIISLVTDVWSSLEANKYLVSFMMAILFSFISPFGDLFFSFIKRQINVKDYSTLLPGHGGILDRLDSVSMVFSWIIWILIIF